MQVFAIANTSSSATPEVRARLLSFGLTEATDVAAADVVVLAVGALEGQSLVRTMHTLRERVSSGLVAVLSSSCTEGDWHALLPKVPSLVSCAATEQELRARLSGAEEARQRMELAMAGERRLTLLRQSLEEVSMIDMRTGMYNRRFLNTRLREALSAAKRYARPLTLCVFRIQDYVDLVASEGDDVVAQMIESLSDVLSASLRSADVQAWIQEDEFAILLPETPAEGAQRVVDRVISQAQAIGSERGVAFRVFGHYASPDADEVSAEAFIERARNGLRASNTHNE